MIVGYNESSNSAPLQQTTTATIIITNSAGKETTTRLLADCGGRPPPSTRLDRHFAALSISSSPVTSSPPSLLLLQEQQQQQLQQQQQQQLQQQQQQQLERRTSPLGTISTPILLDDQCRPQMLDSPETEAQHQTKLLQHPLQPTDTTITGTFATSTKSHLDDDNCKANSELVLANSCDNIPSKLQPTNQIADELPLLDQQLNLDGLCESPTKFQLRALSDKPITFASATKQHRRRQEEKVLQQLQQETSAKKQDKQSDKRPPYPVELDPQEINNLLISSTTTEQEKEATVETLQDTSDFKKEFSGLNVHIRDLLSKLESNPWIQTPALPPNLHIANLSHEVISETLNYFVICGERLTLMTKTYDDIDAVVKLLQEKEVDLELAARIGQDLLEQNKQLKSSIQELEDELNKRKDDVQQLKHELASKSSLLQTFIEEEDDDDDELYHIHQGETKESSDHRSLLHTETSEHNSLSFLVANETPELTAKRHLINNNFGFDSDSDTSDDQQKNDLQPKLIRQNESMLASSPHKEKSWQFNRLVSSNQDEVIANTTAPKHYYPDQSLKNSVVTGNNASTKHPEKLGEEIEILQRTDAILNTVRLTEKDNEEQRLLVQNVTLQLVESNKRLCELQEELAIKSEQNQQQQERIQRLMSQLRDSERRLNEVGSENDSLQNSIKVSLEYQKELSDELKDCKRNLSELLSVFVELQQESRRYRLASKADEVPHVSYGLTDTIASTTNSGVGENRATPLDRDQHDLYDEEDDVHDDANDGDVDIPNDPINNNKLLTANDASYYWQSPYDLSDDKSANYHSNHKQSDHHHHKEKASILNQNNARNLLQINHHSIINTDSEDASLGYESENSTTASTTVGNSSNQQQQPHSLGHITNGRRRLRRYQQHRQLLNNPCCSATVAGAASSQSMSAHPDVNHHHHHHCSCRFEGSDPPIGSQSAHHGSVTCDCLHRFVQPIPICLHSGVSFMGQSCHLQCQQQQNCATGLSSSQRTVHDQYFDQQQQSDKPQSTNMVEGSNDLIGGPVASYHVDENEGKRQQASDSTDNNLSSSTVGNVCTTPRDDESAATATTTSSKPTNRPVPNNSLLSNKLRLIKMMEGSKYLKQWERLASLDLGSILHTVSNNSGSEDDLAPSFDSNSIAGGSTTTVSQEDSYEKRRQNAAATVATLSGLRSQLLSQISLSSPNDSRGTGMIDDGQQHHESSSATTAASTPLNSASSSSLPTSSTTNDNNQSELMIDVGRNGINTGIGRGTSHEFKKRPCIQTRPTTSGFNLLLSQGVPANDNFTNKTTNGTLNGLGALLGGKAVESTATMRAGGSRLSANCVTNVQTQQQSTKDNVTKALELKLNKDNNICGGIIPSTLSLKTQNGPPLTMDEIRRKLRLTDSSSDSDSDESPSQLIEDHLKDKKGSSDTNGHLIDILTVVTAVIIGINENFGEPMLH